MPLRLALVQAHSAPDCFSPESSNAAVTLGAKVTPNCPYRGLFLMGSLPAVIDAIKLPVRGATPRALVGCSLPAAGLGASLPLTGATPDVALGCSLPAVALGASLPLSSAVRQGRQRLVLSQCLVRRTPPPCRNTTWESFGAVTQVFV